MRRGIVAILTAGLTLTSAAAHSATPAKVGSKCERTDEVRKSGSLKLVCVTSSDKLIWVKSSDVTSYSQGPTGRLVYRYVNGRQERLSTYRDWIVKDSRPVKSFDAIRVSAYNSIRSLAVDKTHKNIQFEYIIRPSYPKEISTAVKNQAIEFAKRLSPLLSKKTSIKLILITEKDRKFIDSELGKIVPNQNWQGALQILSDYDTLEKFYSRSGTGGGTASFLPELGYGYYIGHTSSLAKMDTYWPEVAPHEMAHVMQALLANGFNSNFGEGDARAKWHGHFIEGSANTFGMALGFDQLGWYSDEMDILLRNNIRAYKSQYPMKTIDDAIFLIKEIEKRDTPARAELSYPAGQFLWEFFIGKYGVEKYIALLKNVPKSESFDQNIKQTIGVEKGQFYKDAAVYLLASWKRLS